MSGRDRVFVLGGGVAGLVAAFGCADAGHAVTLLESRGWLGGRAFAAVDRATGQRLDNGPHVMLGCYRAMRSLLQRLGTADGFEQCAQLAMSYREHGGGVDRLQLSRWPVPIAMPWALLRLRLPFGARCRAFFGLLGTLLRAAPDRTLGDWLARWRQHGAPEARLWRPLCRAIMNVEPELAAAEDFLRTLREAFLGSAARAAFWLPKRTWGELVGDPAPAALARAGVTLRTGARVVGLPRAGERLRAIELGSGELLPLGPGDRVVSALPWFALAPLLGPAVQPAFGSLQASPIVSAYVQLPSSAPAWPDDGPVTALVDGAPFHFVLRRPGGSAHQLALLSGGDRWFDGQTVAAIADRALQQLRDYFPASDLRGAVVRIRKESLATFIAAPGSAAVRPTPGRLPGGPSNLWVCGDWTAVGLPATLEGAARSGEQVVAAMAAAASGRP
jgi:squalene-associated FAD-dependent desaturase